MCHKATPAREQFRNFGAGSCTCTSGYDASQVRFPNISFVSWYRSSCWSDQSTSSFAGLSRSRKHSVSQFLVQLYSSRPNVRANFSHKLMGRLQNFQVCSNIILNGVRERLLRESENITQKYMHVNRKVHTHTLDSNRWL